LYAVTWLLGGIFLDAVGTRLGLAFAVVFWSLINILTGLATSVFGFASFRFLLGIGEGFNWPGASKTVAEWFPSQERSLAVAIFDSGSSVGGAGCFGHSPHCAGLWLALRIRLFRRPRLCLAVAWLRVYHPLDRHPRVTPEEVAFIRAGQDAPSISAERGVQRWLKLARDRNVWGIVLGRALTDPIWWFYVFWLPQYPSDAREFSLQRIALFAWMPFVAADLGNFTGGWISGYCTRREVSVLCVRTWVCAVSCLPILAGIPAASVHNVYFALGLIALPYGVAPVGPP
jgi:ACS family hexuronate transporter-like MFS transporter